MSGVLRYSARIGAYLITPLLAAVDRVGARLVRPAALRHRPSRRRRCDHLAHPAHCRSRLNPALLLAMLLVCLKLMIGVFLLATLLWLPNGCAGARATMQCSMSRC